MNDLYLCVKRRLLKKKIDVLVITEPNVCGYSSWNHYKIPLSFNINTIHLLFLIKKRKNTVKIQIKKNDYKRKLQVSSSNLMCLNSNICERNK